MTQTHDSAAPAIAPARISPVFVSRRQFIQLGLAVLGAGWAGALVQSRLFPAASSTATGPVSFPLSELPVGGAKAVTYAGTPVIVLRTAEGLRAFSLICTHLGCQVQWQAAGQEFYCPCHDGHYDQFGEVVAGPPPLPLEAIAVQVAGDTVTVGEAG